MSPTIKCVFLSLFLAVGVATGWDRKLWHPSNALAASVEKSSFKIPANAPWVMVSVSWVGSDRSVTPIFIAPDGTRHTPAANGLVVPGAQSKPNQMLFHFRKTVGGVWRVEVASRPGARNFETNVLVGVPEAKVSILSAKFVPASGTLKVDYDIENPRAPTDLSISLELVGENKKSLGMPIGDSIKVPNGRGTYSTKVVGMPPGVYNVHIMYFGSDQVPGVIKADQRIEIIGRN